MCKCNYFTVEDLIKSTTAESLKIDNQPNVEIRRELRLTACKLNFIAIIARSCGATIRVTSGYRCPRLNELVDGAEDSLHMQGRAVDFAVSDMEVKHKLYEVLTDPLSYRFLGICEVMECKSYLHVGFLKRIDVEE